MYIQKFMKVLASVAGVVLCGIAAPTLAGDMDGDGIVDAIDVCNNTPAGTAVDVVGRPVGDTDQDCDADLEDYALFQQALTGVIPPPPGMVFIPAGEYAMGCHEETSETCYSDWLPVHDVSVNSFYMDVYEVTNQQYCDYLNSAYVQGQIEIHFDLLVYKAGGSEPYCETWRNSRITWEEGTFGVIAGKEDHPMVTVSWYGAAAYCNWRSAQEGRTPCYDLSTWECDFDANGYRLPTEAEWEYAARGGEHDPYYAYPWGNTIDGSMANYVRSGDPYDEGTGPATTPVGYYDGGQTPPGSDMANGYGLYDMAGNVWEWCNDWFDPDYYDSSQYDNPLGPVGGNERVVRGGWLRPDNLRCAVRGAYSPGFHDDLIRYLEFNQGFRVVRGN